ncbi:hypothetical protein O181_074806 [Austropuccinia psidii MF-1]|uniref:Uncharacterized protein n=1 Tax=Austropuccinia psidii MF-1 TaxID=1389203 RepID=A0A9Q3I9K5_9BASI|nr:hypothetical protein [Austropuccinia psidii MF-1]
MKIPLRLIVDIQQSTAWRTLTWAHHDANEKGFLELVFSVFVDWFNPHGRKLSGKKESIGCIILNSLNLPPTLHHKPGYSMLFSLIPGPNPPDTSEISNIISPLVDDLLELQEGFNVFTFNHPQGRKVYVQLLPTVSYLVAMHKSVGFGSHSAFQFCAWCKADLKDLQSMKIGTKRSAFEIHEAAHSWKMAPMVTLQEKNCKESGVRWSELNFLPYQLANMHVALGVMHNWLEGVLQEHFRYQWGFQMMYKKIKG